MKRAAVCFSMTVLVIFSIYVSLKIADNSKISPTYEGVIQTTINGAVDKTGSASTIGTVVSDFRNFDTVCEAILLFSTAAGILAVLGKSKKSKGGS